MTDPAAGAGAPLGGAPSLPPPTFVPPSGIVASRGPRAAVDRGALLWDFIETFVASRRLFQGIHALYDQRVIAAASRRGVTREQLKLPPRDLFALFHLPRLEHLRDARLHPLRRMAFAVFGEEGDSGLMDAYCGHIFHEVSILSREHRSVGRFVRRHDPRRYQRLFEEVSGYYPERLRRVRRFFGLAMRRLEELLPTWSHERIVMRSAWLFGESLSRRAWGRGREALYERMYPRGGVIRGYVEAARSFDASGFGVPARQALVQAEQAATVLRESRTLMADERRAVADVAALRDLMATKTEVA